MTCGDQYPYNSLFEKHFAGIRHFLQEKSLFTTVHPIWVVIIACISFHFTNSPIERLLIITFSFYSVLLEMLNSSIEHTNDRNGCEFNNHTKIAKELSASVTTLSRLPLLLLASMIFYRNWNSCNKLTACD